MDDDFEFPTTSNMEEGLDMDMDVPEDDDPVSPILKVGEEKEIGKNGLKLLAMKLKFIILGLCLMEPSLTLAEIAKHLSSSSLANDK